MADQHITCATCGRSFLWTTGEQRFFRERGLQQPRHCPACRRARREGGTPVTRPRAVAPAPPRSPTALPRRSGHHPTRRPSPYRSFGLIALIVAGSITGALVWSTDLSLPLAWVLSISAATFFAYGYDKSIAGAGLTRVPELVLLGLALLGGTLGAMLGMLVFQHKVGSKTAGFRDQLAAVVAVQVIAAVGWVWLTQG